MRARWTTFGSVAAAVAAAAWVALSASGLGDYPHDGQRAVDALAGGDVHGFLSQPALMGSLSLLLRAPFVAIAQAFDGGDLWSYRAGAFACALVFTLFGVALSRSVRARGGDLAAQLAPVALVIAIAAFAQSIYYGHPEELLGAALCVAAVLYAVEGRATLAGVLLGLALATKQWALLAVLPVLLAAPRGRVRLGAIASALAFAAVLPSLLVSVDGFVAIQHQASLTPNSLMSRNVWWLLAAPREYALSDGVGSIVVSKRYLDPALAQVPHALIVALALPLSALALWRRRGRALGVDAFALLALLFLLRCVLDPVNNLYYHVPFLLSLLAFETLGARRVPVLTLLAGGGLLVSFTTAVTLSDARDNLVYLVWTLPLAAHLARLAFASAGPRQVVERAPGHVRIARA